MRHLLATTVLAATTAALSSGCQPRDQVANPYAALPADPTPPAVRVDPGLDASPEVSHAIAVLHPTAGHAVRGTVRFQRSGTGDGLIAVSDLTGLPGPVHAHHIHLLGDCSAADGTSAGTHFNFDGSATEPPADIERITGDLGNLEADENGRVDQLTELPEARLSGPYSILGRSVVVHAAANDPDEPPIGAAGARLACGVIGIDQA